MRIASLCCAYDGQTVPRPAILSNVTGTQELSYVHLATGHAHICAYSVAVEWTPQEIKSRRAAKGWDQNQLAAELGVSRRAITNWETGQAEPRGENRRRLDAILGDTPQPDISLQGATDAQFIAEMARRLAIRGNPPGVPEEDLWWPRSSPQAQMPTSDTDNATGTQEG